MTAPRYIVTTRHGESGSIASVVDTQAHPDEQPCVLASFSTANYGGSFRARALEYASKLNAERAK